MHLLKELTKVPNLITLFRAVSIPVLLYLAFINSRQAFSILFTFSWLSDTIDGYIARLLGQSTEFGAKFDSITDDIGAVFLLFEAYLLFPELAKEYGLYVLISLFLLAIGYLFRIFKAKNVGIHLYSSKVTAFLLGFFFFILLYFGFNPYLFWIGMALSYLSNLELILVIIFRKRVDENTRSLFF